MHKVNKNCASVLHDFCTNFNNLQHGLLAHVINTVPRSGLGLHIEAFNLHTSVVDEVVDDCRQAGTLVLFEGFHRGDGLVSLQVLRD